MIDISRKLQLLQRWFERKQHLARQFFECRVQNFQPRKGDIYLVEFGINVGYEIDKRRPAIVFQTNKLRYSQLYLVIPLTTKVKRLHNRRQFVIIEPTDLLEGRIEKSTLLVDQMRVVSAVRLVRPLGKIRPERLNDIKKSILYLME